ncbi:hypothetical protein M408DRAFT_15495 [Serendipita vermifera MAFF 305830]|uniref:PIG-U-domain-containing protein n=1 Tax=Serendipita vermifera MAFF 305830 TaxID=933852 RepID=A0A0C3B162_SERVB|nr:hypothetical protein M408DRAFT_15495 [Serendipita vermifera MAFF 305830]
MATFGSLVVLRLLLAFSPIPNYLYDNQQLTSPLTSYTRLKEGVFLLQNGFDPYAGQLFRHSPIQLALFSTVMPPNKYVLHAFWTLLDAATAWNLANIWKKRSGTTDWRRETIIQASYLLNPYLLFTSLALSTSTLDNALCVYAISLAASGKRAPALFALALLTQSSLYSVLLLPPIVLLLCTGPASRLKTPIAPSIRISDVGRTVFTFVTYMLVLMGISTLVAGNLGWMKETWGATLTVPDLTPNVGLWWYFFTEMFDHFRSFFLMVFTALVTIAMIPLTIKFQHDPLYATYLLVGNISLFKSYPTMADPGLFLSMISIFPELWPYLRHPLPTVMWHMYAATLLPLFNNLWLGHGTGNSNFFYAATLVFGVANGAAFLDSTWAGLIAPYGKPKQGYTLLQI